MSMGGLPLEVRFEREPSGFERARLAPNVVGGGSAAPAPVIEDTRNVIDPGGPLDHPQKKIVVLGAVEFRPKTSDLLQNIGPDQSEVTNIVTGEKIIGRP